MAEANQEIKAEVIDLKENTALDEELCGKLNTLWADKGIQTTYENRHLFQLPGMYNLCGWIFGTKC